MAPAGGGSSRAPIDFASLAAAALDRAEMLVPQWLPGGVRRGHEWVCGDLGGAPGDSCSVNLVTGRWADFASDERGNDLISLYAAIRGLSQAKAALELMEQLGIRKSELAPARSAPRSASVPAGDERPEPPAEEERAGARKPRSSMWRAVVPVPPHAPAPTFEHWARQASDLVATWEYRFEGTLYGYVTRFRTSDGGKETLPHTWCMDESDARGTCRWHWKQWEEPRPLYVPATLLSGDLSLPVVLVEGEKCALAGHQLLGHEFDFVSWPGGARAWAKACWGWLKGRTVYLWPDCDSQRVALTPAEREQGVDPATKPFKPEAKQPGVAAMVGIGSLLAAEHGCTVFMRELPKPGNKPDGWDIADAIAEGWDAAKVRDFIRGSVAFVPPDAAVIAKAGLSSPTTAGAVRAGEGAPADDDASVAWVKHLQTSASGACKAVRENVVLALDGWPERGIAGIVECLGLIRFNQFTNNVEKARATPWGTPAGDWAEADELLMGDWLTRTHRLPSMARQALEEAVLVVAHRHTYHPLRERLQALRGRWAAERPSLLDVWLRRTCLEEDEFDDKSPLQQYLTLAGRWFVMGMVARVLEPRFVQRKLVVGPGCKFDYMLVFEGPTGWGKSTTASVLGSLYGEYFADTGLDVTNKDSLMNIQGIWVYEWSELEERAKQEIGAVKRFISSPKDRFRATFDRRPAFYPRQVVFVGTTEEATYLLDHKGNRRFWPVRITRPPDLDWLRDNLEDMLAEAVYRVDKLERFHQVQREQRELFDPQQNARQVESSLESAIVNKLYDEEQKIGVGQLNYALVPEVAMAELLTVIGYTIDKQTDAVVKKAGSILHKIGWEIRRSSRPGRPRVYVRPPRSTDPLARVSENPAPAAPPGSAAEPAEALDDDMPF